MRKIGRRLRAIADTLTGRRILLARIEKVEREAAERARDRQRVVESEQARSDSARHLDDRLAAFAARIGRLELENEFLRHEWRHAQERERWRQFERTDLAPLEPAARTLDSFDFQWRELNYGIGLSGDDTFSRQAPELVARFVGRPRGWFAGRRVLDLGCGSGRFTRALLDLGAAVVAIDESPAALDATREYCRDFTDRLEVSRRDLLAWDEIGTFDLVFCYGVVHHTGNLYLAIRNAARKVIPGGRLVLMVYGMPTDADGFAELIGYERVREELRGRSLDERKRILLERYGPRLAHGMFDATSPAINDLMSEPEIAELLAGFGFGPLTRTFDNRNLHVVAERLRSEDPPPGA